MLPQGGVRPAFGTNPIGLGFAIDGDRFIVDRAVYDQPRALADRAGKK